MRRVYRGALPVLSSKQKWETALLPAGLPSADGTPGHA
ncbi:bifunctional udp-galacto furanosyl transferase glft [Mycobacterium tuberculosis]|nr:bifunctional udp-galacto furanosyl transferase glft [Mycobacterium tuberculosis]